MKASESKAIYPEDFLSTLSIDNPYVYGEFNQNNLKATFKPSGVCA